MGKYCETYKCQCTSKACGESECAKALETRRRAEELRGVILDKDGAVIVVRKAEPGFSEPKTFKPNVVGPPAPGESAARDKTLILLVGTSILTVLLLVAALGYVGYLMIFPQKGPVPQPVAQAVVPPPPPPNTPPPAPAPTPAPQVLPPEYTIPPILRSTGGGAPLAPRRSGIDRDSTERDSSPAGQLKARGNEVRREGNLRQAQELYLAAISADPDYYEGYNNLGNTFTDTGEHMRAAPIYQRGLVIVPESETIRFNLGNTLMRAGRYAEAAAEFERVVYYNESDMEARLLLGVCYFHLGRMTESSSVFQSILAVNKDHALANFNLALVMDRLGRNDLGDAYRREAFRVQPQLARR